MGRDLAFYVVNTNISHDKTCKICMNYEFELSYDELQQGLYEFLNPGKSEWNDIEKYKEIQKNIKLVLDQNPLLIYNKSNYKYEYNTDWCPRCHMFANGLYNTKALIKSINFHHSYSNNIWLSDWHFYNMHPGKNHSDFCNRFDSKKMYREISHDDIKSIKYNIDTCGKPYRTIDIEALNETKGVLAFCEKWLDHTDSTVIYSYEP